MAMSSSTTGGGSPSRVVANISYEQLLVFNDFLEYYATRDPVEKPIVIPLPGLHKDQRIVLVFGDSLPPEPAQNSLYFKRADTSAFLNFKGVTLEACNNWVPVPSSLKLTDIRGRSLTLSINDLKSATPLAPSHVTPEKAHGDEDEDEARSKKARAGRPRVPKANRTEEQVQADKVRAALCSWLRLWCF